MPLPSRIPLNPSDYFFYAHHRMMRSRGQGGNIAFMRVDVEGHPDPNCVRSALRRAFVTHPVLMSGIRLSRLWNRPYWRIPRDREAAAREAAAAAHLHEDLRRDRDAERHVEERCNRRYVSDWDLAAGPQIRLEQYDLPAGRCRLCLRWPHLVMDAGGALWFLSELARFLDANADPNGPSGDRLPPGLLPDHEPLDPLAGRSLLERATLFVQSFSGQQQHRGLKAETLIRGTPPPFRDQRCLHRAWDEKQFRRIRAHARRCTPPGPAIYARFLGACVLRALHRIFTDEGIDSEAYLITLPMSVVDMDHPGPVARPVPGNYLVSPTLCGRRELMDDREALGEDLSRQIEAYRATRTHLKQWAMIRAASASQAWFYPWLLRLPLGLETLASGFSYYGEGARPLRRLGGARVTNLWGAGPLPSPPGWNPVFSRFGDRLNLSLTYARPAIPDRLARRYVDLIEAEALAGEEP